MPWCTSLSSSDLPLKSLLEWDLVVRTFLATALPLAPVRSTTEVVAGTVIVVAMPHAIIGRGASFKLTDLFHARLPVEDVLGGASEDLHLTWSITRRLLLHLGEGA